MPLHLDGKLQIASSTTVSDVFQVPKSCAALGGKLLPVGLGHAEEVSFQVHTPILSPFGDCNQHQKGISPIGEFLLE